MDNSVVTQIARIGNEINTQSELISQIKTELDGRAADIVTPITARNARAITTPLENNTIELQDVLGRVKALPELPKDFSYTEINLSTMIEDTNEPVQCVYPYDVSQGHLVTVDISWSSTYDRNIRFWLAYEWWTNVSTLIDNVLVPTNGEVHSAKVIFEAATGDANQILFKLQWGVTGINISDVFTVHSLKVTEGADPDAVNYSQYKPQSISVRSCNLTINATAPCYVHYDMIKNSALEPTSTNLTIDNNYTLYGLACGSTILAIHSLDGKLFDTISVSSGRIISVLGDSAGANNVGAIIALPGNGDCVVALSTANEEQIVEE